jgi:hypothetical protein
MNQLIKRGVFPEVSGNRIIIIIIIIIIVR